MSDCNDTVQIEHIGLRQIAQPIHTGSNIQKRIRPTTTITEPTILKTPHGVPTCPQIGTTRAQRSEIIGGLPATTVDHYHDWGRLCGISKIEITKLPDMITVGNALVRIYHRLSQIITYRQHDDSASAQAR
jgi:hypothetical protein